MNNTFIISFASFLFLNLKLNEVLNSKSKPNRRLINQLRKQLKTEQTELIHSRCDAFERTLELRKCQLTIEQQQKVLTLCQKTIDEQKTMLINSAKEEWQKLNAEANKCLQTAEERLNLLELSEHVNNKSFQLQTPEIINRQLRLALSNAEEKCIILEQGLPY